MLKTQDLWLLSQWQQHDSASRTLNLEFAVVAQISPSDKGYTTFPFRQMLRDLFRW